MADEEKKEKEGTVEASEKKGSSLKWIIIGVVVLLVLGGGGFFSWKTFFNPAEKETGEEGAATLVPLGPTYPLETFIVNLAGTGGERYLKVSMELELKDSSLVPGSVKKVYFTEFVVQ
jgi:flagellar FliL protein